MVNLLVLIAKSVAQHNSRLSYDKMMNHINQLEHKGMIHTHRQNNSRSITITGKGKMFLK